MTDLAFHIRQFLPDADGVELERRVSLLIARDYSASLVAKVDSELAYNLAWAAHDMAGTYLFAEVAIDRLEVALAYCRNLVHAAFLADHLAGEIGE